MRDTMPSAPPPIFPSEQKILDQIARAMRALVDDRVLLRLGKGVYAKARMSSISGRVVLANPKGFQIIAQEAS